MLWLWNWKCLIFFLNMKNIFEFEWMNEYEITLKPKSKKFHYNFCFCLFCLIWMSVLIFFINHICIRQIQKFNICILFLWISIFFGYILDTNTNIYRIRISLLISNLNCNKYKYIQYRKFTAVEKHKYKKRGIFCFYLLYMELENFHIFLHWF